MAKINSVESAGRYDGLGIGPRHEYSFETQTGVPIDGGNALLRKMAPFTLRLLPPEELLVAAALLEQGIDLHSAAGAGRSAAESSAVFAAQARSVDLINAAAQGVDQNKLATELSNALAQVSAVSAETTALQSFISEGQFFGGQDYAVTLSDAYAAADIALQLKKILEAPPLTLLVNPNNMAISYMNVQGYATRTRDGYLFERWGEDQATISFSGSTGAFIAGVANAPGTNPTLPQASGKTTSPSGVQFASKRDSASWQNLMSLFQFYKSNGYIYDTLKGSEAHYFAGAVAIDYDQWTYVGHIESFNYSYDSTKPHHIDWSMEFKVDRMYDNAEQTTVVLPQTAPTESPQGFLPSKGAPNSFGDALAGIAGTWEESIDRDSTFGVVPFELLVPTS